ncbi:TetR/AcrR family transcriptional regulator [Nocardioides stalactiti]|uniref:TetR/AcrR family transcriptional regulator n=1 Tax=Nocardioides stalactiti TaxID=2755356 RepID=UPI001600218E|nr:TetR/AcrR family transcriptional regulator [Nocardioides stalactiti]
MSQRTPEGEPRKRRYAKRLPKEERREHLLDATLRVLVREGYGKVSIDAIAKEAGVTRPVVYGAYDGLEPLLHALLDRTRQRALTQAMALLHDAGNPTDVDAWVLEAVSLLIDQVRADPDVWRPVLGITQNAPAIVRDRIAETREVIRQYIASGLAAGLQLRGGPQLDTEVVAHLVLVTAEEFGRMMLEDPPRYQKDRLVAALAGLLSAAPPPAAP